MLAATSSINRLSRVELPVGTTACWIFSEGSAPWVGSPGGAGERCEMKRLSVDKAEQMASQCSQQEVSSFLSSRIERVLLALLQNPVLTENEILALLNRKELPAGVIEEIAQTKRWVSSYPVKRALTKHPKTPVRTSLELLKFLFVFDLVGVSLQPAIPHEVKELAENQILSQVPKLPIGQQVTLARRSTSRIVGELLRKDHRLIIEAALDNPRLDEATLIQALNRHGCPSHLVEAVANHRKWSFSYGIRLALVRTNGLSMGKILQFTAGFKLSDLKEIAEDPRVSRQLQEYLQQVVTRPRRS